MIYEITYIDKGEGEKQKLAHPVKDRKALLAKRNSAKNLKLLDQLQQKVAGYKLTKRTTSILDILKDLNQTLNDGDSAYYRIPDTEEEVAQEILLYENAGGTESEYWVDYDYRRLRLMVEISDFNSAQVESEIALIQKDAEALFPDAKITVVGNIPQYVTMMQYLVRGQMLSFIISILIISYIKIIFGIF